VKGEIQAVDVLSLFLLFVCFSLSVLFEKRREENEKGDVKPSLVFE